MHSCRMLSSLCGSNATQARCAERTACLPQPWRLGMVSMPRMVSSDSSSSFLVFHVRGSRRLRYASTDVRVATASAAGKQFAGGRAVERPPGTEPPPLPPPIPQQQPSQHQSSPSAGRPPAADSEAGHQQPDGTASRESAQRTRRQQPRALRRSAPPPPPAERNAAAAAAVAAADAAPATSEPRAPGPALQSNGGDQQGSDSDGRNAFLAAGSSFRSLGIGEPLTSALAAAGFAHPSHVQVRAWTDSRQPAAHMPPPLLRCC